MRRDRWTGSREREKERETLMAINIKALACLCLIRYNIIDTHSTCNIELRFSILFIRDWVDILHLETHSLRLFLCLC